MKKHLLLILLPSILIGCSARLLSASPENIVVSNVNKATEKDALRIADAECAKHRKQAFRLSVEGDTATYRCVE